MVSSHYREESEYRIPLEAQESLLNAKLPQNNLEALFKGFKEDFKAHIAGFPEFEEPAVFGQHANAEITMRIEDSKQFVESLELLEPNRVELASQLIDARFPDYRAIIPKSHSTRTVVDTAALLKAVRVAYLFARDNANIVRMRIDPPNGGETAPGGAGGQVSMMATSTTKVGRLSFIEPSP